MFLLTNPDLHHGLLGAKIESLRCMANKDADECFPSSMYAPNWATILIFASSEEFVGDLGLSAGVD